NWKYLDNGSDQGTNWTTLGFDDSSWTNGPAELGYGDGDEATVVGFGGDPQNVFITTYFRHSFTLTNAAGYSSLLMNVKRDDGAVVYLNGVEIARFNMNPGPVSYLTLALNATDDGANFYPAAVPFSPLVEGNNVLAVGIHQTTNTSSDISFEMDLSAVPTIIRNQSPTLALTSPTNHAPFLAPSSILLNASATDPDGSVTNVEFYADNVKLGNVTEEPYDFVWNTPPIGLHTLRAVATDNQGASSFVEISVAVYDSLGTPLVDILSPAHGSVFDGPTNLAFSARVTALRDVIDVLFLTNGVDLLSDNTSPYSVVWTNAAFGTNTLAVWAADSDGRVGYSPDITVVIIAPPTNTVAPTIAAQVPAAGITVTSLTSVTVTFSERVINVDAADLLVNFLPATTVSGSISNYTFTFPQPPYGEVDIRWDAGHGITDIGYPSNLAFNANGPGAAWGYNLIDAVPPTIAARVPAAGATVTNLTQVSVTFSEPVHGVDAADLLINGTPAVGLNGVPAGEAGSSYTFSFAQPAGGPVSISWAGAHGIADLADTPNPFNATGPGATWNYTLDLRTVLVQSNSTWRFLKGFAEASGPIDAWRQFAFDDSGWSNAPSPFFYGDTSFTNAANPGTAVTDMLGGAYSSIFFRKQFNVVGSSSVTNLFLVAAIDDGAIVWINGTEVLRNNMAAGEIPYNGSAPTAANEPGNNGVPYTSFTLANANNYLVEGPNVIAVHGFNNQPATSSDFCWNAQLYAFVLDPSQIPPRVSTVSPAAGGVFSLTNITVRFTEAVIGVDAGDLLIGGVPATGLSSTTNTTYTFSFEQPPFGPVNVTWAAGHGITDLDSPPKPFDGAAAGSTFQYSLINPSAPTIALQSPLAGASVATLTQLTVQFSEPVTGVDAADLRINGAPASTLQRFNDSTYAFTFPQPPYGAVAVGWVTGHGITDTEPAANPFDSTRPGSTWSYTLVDQVRPTIVSRTPPAGALVTNLTQLSITFSEPVTGVNASDLLINDAPASTLQRFNDSTYAFTFAQPNATFLNVTWVNNHGIRDLAPVPNSFDATGPGATWSYTTPDTLAPAVAAIDPAPFVTLRSLTRIAVTFTEPVAGVDTNDLLLNNRRSLSVNGSGAGPYTFNFLPPSNGVAEVRWAPGHAISDLATPLPNSFGGGEWTYIVDPAAAFAGKVIFSEIMFHPASDLLADEWVELHNVTSNLVSLAGWRFARGADFIFPNVAIPAGGYLVVAADTNAFRARYPGVNNVIGNWTGRLANSDETLELVTPLGESVNTVHYASEGDWATRARGRPAQRVAGITLSGTTATVTVPQHGYNNGETVFLSGANQPEYNGRFVIANAGSSTFTITVPGAPASPATGTIVCRHILDNNASGWSWFSAADGFGSSLELVNASLPNSAGQNWAASTSLQGTPGASNSTRATNVAPYILDAAHFPPVPRSTNAVTISARVQEEMSNGVAAVTLFWRNHSTTSPGPFTSAPMFDDGGHNDGVANDRLYAASVAPQADRTVIEFYLQAADTSGLTRTWPAPAWQTNNTYAQTPNALYQVDDQSSSTNMPFLRLVLTETERAEFAAINQNSDAEMNATFISLDGDGAKVRYGCGLRIRGAGSRNGTPKNWRLNIPTDNRWNGLSEINLNTRFIHSQLAGSVLSQKAGLPVADARIVQVRLNGNNLAPSGTPQNGGGTGGGFGAYILVEPINGDFAANHFPNDSQGNVYRASSGTHDADLASGGTNVDFYYVRGYSKTSNQSDNDWTDLASLTAVLSTGLPDASYVQAVRTNLNLQFAMRYFAVCTFFGFGETALCNGIGDDYAMYRGLNDPRFILLAHDFDTILGQGDSPTYWPVVNAHIWMMLNPPNPNGDPATLQTTLLRFMRHPEHAPVYFAELKRLADGPFSPAQADPVLDQILSGWGPDQTLTINPMKNYLASRRVALMTQVPLALTVSNTLATQSGFPFTATPAVTLFGTANAIDTRSVRVNGGLAGWSAWEARWTNSVTLQPGINRVLMQSFNSNDVEFARATVDIWYDDGNVASVSGAVAADTVWSAANGPYQVTASLTVSAGVTLTIQPGTTVYLSPGVGLTVANGGRLLAEGVDTARIRFSAAPGGLPGEGANWGGFTI
ncbi:MAG TPA: Ig-like domain-containing protein, partial [Verrucomicrobiae bacterium]|nr:Ig-like domain-containing protein [Verrucomicrobiae bacterium]